MKKTLKREGKMPRNNGRLPAFYTNCYLTSTSKSIFLQYQNDYTVHFSYFPCPCSCPSSHIKDQKWEMSGYFCFQDMFHYLGVRYKSADHFPNVPSALALDADQQTTLVFGPQCPSSRFRPVDHFSNVLQFLSTRVKS